MCLLRFVVDVSVWVTCFSHALWSISLDLSDVRLLRFVTVWVTCFTLCGLCIWVTCVSHASCLCVCLSDVCLSHFVSVCLSVWCLSLAVSLSISLFVRLYSSSFCLFDCLLILSLPSSVSLNFTFTRCFYLFMTFSFCFSVCLYLFYSIAMLKNCDYDFKFLYLFKVYKIFILVSFCFRIHFYHKCEQDTIFAVVSEKVITSVVLL